jgi:hypothetical protein
LIKFFFDYLSSDISIVHLNQVGKTHVVVSVGLPQNILKGWVLSILQPVAPVIDIDVMVGIFKDVEIAFSSNSQID